MRKRYLYLAVMLFSLLFPLFLSAQEISNFIVSPVKAVYETGDKVTLSWNTTKPCTDLVAIAIRRSDSTSPDGIKWYRFADDTSNDGQETVIIPAGMAEGGEWRFFVRHVDSGYTLQFPSSPTSSVSYHHNPAKGLALNTFVETDGDSADCGGNFGSEYFISCPGGSCEGNYPPGTQITLSSAFSGNNYGFRYWKGCDSISQDGRICTINVGEVQGNDLNRTVKAHFALRSSCMASSPDFIPFKDPAECDGDGIPDQWEATGYSDGNVLIDLPCYGAEIGKKDVFVWLDHMRRSIASQNSSRDPGSTTLLDETALSRVARIFDERGINLHLEWAFSNHNCTHPTPSHETRFEPYVDDTVIGQGLPEQRISSGFTRTHEAIFHYGLLGSRINSNTVLGSSTTSIPHICSRTNQFPKVCDDEQAFVIAADAGDPADWENLTTSSFMHELGHSLGLGHGGPASKRMSFSDTGEILSDFFAQWDLNNKPNYLSLMNYLYAENGNGLCIINGNKLCNILDYSIFKFFDLDENSLIEADGVKLSHNSCERVSNNPLFALPSALTGRHFKEYQVLYYEEDLLFDNLIENKRLADANVCGGSGISWDGDDSSDEVVDTDTTFDGEHTLLKTDSDWDNLVFNGWSIGKRLAKLKAQALFTNSEPITDPIPVRRFFDTFDFNLSSYWNYDMRLSQGPGTTTPIGLVLFNSGRNADSYSIDASTSNNWNIVSPTSIDVPSGHRVVFQVIVHVPADATTSNEIISIVATSKNNPFAIRGESFAMKVTSDLAIDSDSDGIPDELEHQAGLDANLPDSDSDGLFDAIETFDPITYPEDRDNDGIIDSLDSDNLVPQDSDNDGLPDNQELRYGLDPNNPDTDGDGLNDSIEFGSPRIGDPAVDYDGDGVIDALELGNEASQGEITRRFLDAVVAGTPSVTKVWLNNRSGELEDGDETLGHANSQAVALGDADADGDTDLFVTYRTSRGTELWLNDGQGTFLSRGQIGQAPTTAASIGDLDGDRDLDVFLVGRNGKANQVLLNNGYGKFTAKTQVIDRTRILALVFGDVDRDGDLDAFFTTRGRSGFGIWLNDGNGAFSDSGQVFSGYQGLTAVLGDIDKDGDLDAVVTSLYRQGANIFLNDGEGIFVDSGRKIGTQRSTALALGDMNGDGSLDVVAANADGPSRVWLNNGGGEFTDSGQELGVANSTAVALGDLDGDADLDAVITARNPHWNKMWLNDGTGHFTDSGQKFGGPNTLAVALGRLR